MIHFITVHCQYFGLKKLFENAFVLFLFDYAGSEPIRLFDKARYILGVGGVEGSVPFFKFKAFFLCS